MPTAQSSFFEWVWFFLRTYGGLFLQGAGHKIGRDHVAEIADVDRPRRADARGANVFFFVGFTRDDPLCDLF